jgi:hypothetical protein
MAETLAQWTEGNETQDQLVERLMDGGFLERPSASGSGVDDREGECSSINVGPGRLLRYPTSGLPHEIRP